MTRSVRTPLAAAAAAVLLLAATVTAAGAHEGRADDPEVLGHSSGQEVKRVSASGNGMPSVRGPFPDTEGLTFLGQLTNDELGVERLIFTGASWLSDIWGWTSPATGDEYAIVGTSSGVAFARVTDPANPEFLGMLPTTQPDTLFNFWWDIKTFGDHAYITTEVRDAGVAIVDMTRFDARGPVEPGTAGAVITADARYAGEGYRAAHNISINTDTGFAYLTGVTKDLSADLDFVGGSLVVLDLNADPTAPVEVAQIPGIDSHDAHVVTYEGPDGQHAGAEIAVVFNGGDLEVRIYDVTDKSAIQTLSTTTYPGASFTHQGWLTEDHRFLLVGDEGDELRGISEPRNPDLPDTARTYVFDVSDLDAPTFRHVFDSPAASIDHNLFIDGTTVWQANYTAGVRVLDASDVAGGLAEIAHMDTEPRLPNEHMNHNINIFAGPWGVYPFFESDTVIVSDGLNGLILMRLE